MSTAVLVYDIEASEYLTFDAHGDDLINMLRSASTDAIVILKDCPKLGSVVITAEIDGILFDESEGSYWRSGGVRLSMCYLQQYLSWIQA